MSHNAMETHSIDPFLTQPDRLVLDLLLQDIQNPRKPTSGDLGSGQSGDEGHTKQLGEGISRLEGLNDESSSSFRPTVFTSWDQEDFERLPESVNKLILQPYIRWARGVVRRETDVVFLTHIILYLTTSVPSAITLYAYFSWPHAICHWIMQGLYCGPFTLLLHNHIHNNGVLVEGYKWLDRSFPYILEPLMGHTWHSYYYHHIKCHHVEGNGPDDVSSTIRYQRDELADFLMYWGRFMFFIWIDLPLYFIRKNKLRLAFEFFSCEMRIGLMAGNWSQHALVDENDPDSDFRSSITLIDVASNRHCFNDGWHTAHHLNALRHWRDQPLSFLKTKSKYEDGKALVFHNIDYMMMFVKLMQKDYEHLARCLVPIGDQIGMSNQELADILKIKTRKFTRDDIQRKFVKRKKR
ncbi:Uncharacterized protein BP5553_08826 [Venustampulla echinocandica]|uniref:Fatty acid desaturase domain-containing protein n=1 Tax=Venustampulla echinocandica TaxID=2656787 RepID=A0A370TD24_9HELO|nr:Uncharacterized protein BP5553_08826 [Venustampulla echinocandica]RDL32370.1 Uncharacterized protein BP5553_08826 [Venustampulla echinocandica]